MEGRLCGCCVWFCNAGHLHVSGVIWESFGVGKVVGCMPSSIMGGVILIGLRFELCVGLCMCLLNWWYLVWAWLFAIDLCGLYECWGIYKWFECCGCKVRM